MQSRDTGHCPISMSDCRICFHPRNGQKMRCSREVNTNLTCRPWWTTNSMKLSNSKFNTDPQQLSGFCRYFQTLSSPLRSCFCALNGSVIVKVAPSPHRDAHLIRPCISARALLHMARPMPCRGIFSILFACVM